MNCRRHGSKSSLGFWALVLAADAAFVMAGAAVSLVLLVLAFAALVAGGVVTARRFAESAEPATQVVTRRRV